MIKIFRGISILEGLSLLILLFVAMPIKYILGDPEYVKHVGMAHGLLFVAYVLFAIMTKFELDWKPKTLLIVFAASVIPFGTFYVDKKYLSGK
jgi:integral membrane protein